MVKMKIRERVRERERRDNGAKSRKGRFYCKRATDGLPITDTPGAKL